MSRSTTLLLVLSGTLAGSVLGAALLIIATPAMARMGDDPAVEAKPGGHMGSATGPMKTATVTVEAVDKEKRTLTLKDEDGKSNTVTVPTEVAAFERVKKGDKIKMSYQESMALAVHRAGESKPTSDVQETTQRMEGPNPGRTMQRKQTVSGKIVAVDTKKNILKIKGPQGKTQEVAVEDPDLRERLKELKPGEVVEISYTQAMAVSLEPADK